MLPSDRETTAGGPIAASHAPDADRTLAPGFIVAGRYRIVSLLGRGGMGEVYRAEDLTLGVEVALKFLPRHLADDPGRAQGLYDEVRAARQITHPNVCRVHDVGTADGRPFIAMEYVDGEDLARLLRRIGRLPKEKAIEISQELCRGLAAVHEQGLVHRDLKPANVMLDGRGHVRLGDFGIAAYRDGAADQLLAGTPPYMSPELLRGQRATAASDVFALGLVLTEIFTGRRPAATELRDLTQDSPVKDLDERIRGILEVCLNPDPAERPSAAWVAAALTGGDALQASVAAGHTPSPRAIALAGRSGLLTVRVGAALLASIVLLMIADYVVGGRVAITRYLRLPYSPAALQFKAREHLRALGIDAASGNWASGFDIDTAVLKTATALPKDAQRAFLASPPTSPAFFWYRERPGPLVPLSRNRITQSDPPVTFGDVSITVSPDGTLIAFSRLPPRVASAAGNTPPPDWRRVFALAGLDLATFEPVAPRITTDVTSADTRLAWLERRDTPLGRRRIEASTFRNEILSFSTMYDRVFPSSGSNLSASTSTVQTFGLRAISLIWHGWLLVASIIVWRHLRKGRADLAGAFRLGLVLLLVTLVSQLLMRERLLATLGTDPLLRRLGDALGQTTEVMIFYLAVESFIRRHAPHQFISWSRLLTGHITDPLVGRDVLIGVLGGVLAMLIALAGFGLDSRALGPASASWMDDAGFDAVNSLGYLLAFSSDVAFTLLCTLAFAVELMITRRVWAAMLIAIVLAFPYVLASYATWTGLIVGAMTLPLFVGVQARMGTLAVAAMVTTFYIINLCPISDVLDWRFPATAVPGVIMLGVAFWAFATSTGALRRPRPDAV